MNLANILVVVCNGISDIGKGWLTAAIGRLAPEETLPIKIDPLLNLCFPKQLGVEINELCAKNDIDSFIETGLTSDEHFKISEDFRTYFEAGMKIYPECNIVAGELLRRFLISENEEIRPGEVKKRTFNDVSKFLAQTITNIVSNRKPRNVLIEVGGTIEDSETIYIPGAIRLLQNSDFLGVNPEIVFLTFFDFAEPHIEGAYRVKTQYIRRGIAKVSSVYYGIRLKACIVRRRHVPNEISDEVLKRDLQNVAYETQISNEQIVFFPNVEKHNISDLSKIIENSNLFNTL